MCFSMDFGFNYLTKVIVRLWICIEIATNITHLGDPTRRNCYLINISVK